MRLGFLVPVEPATASSLRGVQGLRAVAALAILASHVWHYSAPDGVRVDLGVLSRYVMPHLALGVTLLFVLSAFLLYRPFALAIVAGTRRPSLGRYLRNRALRIVPAYWFILAVTALLLQTALVRREDGSLDRGALTDPWVLMLDGSFLHSLVPSALLTGIGPAWALSVIVSFYLALPLLVLLALRVARATAGRSPLGAALAPAAVLVLVGVCGKLAAAYLLPAGASGGWGADWPSVLARSFPVHADAFALGLALAAVVAHCEARGTHLRPARRTLAAAAAPALVLAGAKLGSDPMSTLGGPDLYVYDALTAVACMLVVAVVVLPAPGAADPRLVRLLELRPLVALGVVSYSLYLWHEPLVYWLAEHGLTAPGRGGLVLNAAVVLALAFALSTLTYRALERPALLRKTRTRVLGSPQEQPTGQAR